MSKLFEAIDNLDVFTLNELDTWVPERSRQKGWKVKILDVFPGKYINGTTASVELFDKNGKSYGEENMFIQDFDVKIGKTYPCYIDPMLDMPSFEYGKVLEIPSEERGIRGEALPRERYIENNSLTEDKSENLNESNISNYSLNNNDPDDVYISCNIDAYGDSLLCIIPCLYDEENGEVKPSKRDINFINNEGEETYPDIDYDEIINNIPKDILDGLK